MSREKAVRAAQQLVALSSIADDPLIVRAQDQNFSNIDWSAHYFDASEFKRILIDFVRAIVDNEPGCDMTSILNLNTYDREAVVHGLTIAYTSKDGIENG